MRLEKNLGDEDKLEKSFGGEVESAKIMVGEEEWWMAMFAAPFFFFSSSLKLLSLDSIRPQDELHLSSCLCSSCLHPYCTSSSSSL